MAKKPPPPKPELKKENYKLLVQKNGEKMLDMDITIESTEYALESIGMFGKMLMDKLYPQGQPFNFEYPGS